MTGYSIVIKRESILTSNKWEPDKKIDVLSNAMVSWRYWNMELCYWWTQLENKVRILIVHCKNYDFHFLFHCFKIVLSFIMILIMFTEKFLVISCFKLQSPCQSIDEISVCSRQTLLIRRTVLWNIRKCRSIFL